MPVSCARRSLRSGLSALMLSNRSHVSSGGRLMNCLVGAKHLTLMHLPSISSSTTRSPVFGQLVWVLMNLHSLRLHSTEVVESLRWCRLCLVRPPTDVAAGEMCQCACAVPVQVFLLVPWTRCYSVEYEVRIHYIDSKEGWVADLDSSDPKSDRSISNFPVLSKMLERLASKQLVTYT